MKIFYRGVFVLISCIFSGIHTYGQVAIQAHASPDTVCPGQQTMLWATASPVCGPSSSPCTGNATTVQVGTGTVQQNYPFGYPSPYGNWDQSARHQYLFHAAELLAVFGGPAQINSLGMDIGIPQSGSILDNFTIQMGCIPPLDSLIAYVPNTLTTVYQTDFNPGNNPGWTNQIFTTPYYWDGVSDLIIDMCFYDPNTNNNVDPGMVCTTTAFRSAWFTYDNGMSECGIAGTQLGGAPPYVTYFQRPNFKFNICVPKLADTSLTWTPNTGPNGVTIIHADTTYANPLNQTTYTVTFIQNGDTSTSSVVVYMDTSVQLKVTPDTLSECSPSAIQLQAQVTIAAGSGASPNSLIYSWTAVPPTSPTPPSGTGPGFASGTVTPTVNTIYICKVTGPGVNCTLIDTAKITIGNGLHVPGTEDSISCATSDNGKIYINMSSGTAPYTYVWTPTGPDADSLTNLGPGTYTVKVTDAAGCVGYDTFHLAAPPPLTILLDSSNIKCYNVDIGTISAIVSGGRGPYTYTWDPAEANSNQLTGLPAGHYGLTVTDASGCTISDSVNITQPSQLISSATSTNYTSYNADNGTITVTTSGGTPGYTYSSSPNIAGLPNATNLDTGTYIITVCDANHCCVNDTAHISEPPPIDITFAVVNNLCFGQCNGTATVSASGGVLPYTYQWNTVPPSVVLGTGPEITGLCAGTYQVIVTDHTGISVPKDTIITAPAALGMKIDSTTITCFNANNGSLKDSVYGGTPQYSYSWTPAEPNAATVTNLGPGMYIVNVTDANGCPAADTAYLGQPAPVTAAIISTDSVTCSNATNGFANVQAGGGRPPYTYSWSGSSSVDSFASNLSPGTQTVTVKDASGCTASATFSIGAPAPLTISAIDTTSAHCAQSHDGSAIAVVTGGSPAYIYSWDGTSTGTVDSIQGLASGPHTLSVTDSKGCSTSATFIINTQYTLAISITSDSVTCNGYSNGAAYATPLNGFPIYTYQWNPSPSIADSATGLSAGMQSVTVTDVYGCTADGSVMVGQPIAIIASASFTDPLCTGQSNGTVTISASGTIAPYTYTFGGSGTVHAITDVITGLTAGTYSYTVTDGRGCTQTGTVTLTDPSQLILPPASVTGISCANEANGIIQLNPTGGTPPYTYAWSPGGYTASMEDSLGPANYTITVTDANGCTATTSDSLSAPPLIYASFEVDSTSCPGSADGHIIVNATGGTPGNPITYTYSLDGVNYQIGNNFFSLLAGTYTIYVKDSPGCVLDTFTTVYQPSAITASINPQDSVIPLGGSIQLFSLIGNLTTQTVNSYSWSPELGLSCIDCPDPIASPYVSTEYYLTVNYGKGCIVIDSNLIQVGPHAPVYIPNAFTPNGDNIDDYFSVYGTTLYGVGMKIFNRWGEKVFDSGSTQWASWDGTYKGVLQPPGVYVYYVQLVYIDGSQETREGSITLIR